ncbi:hypothetical protein [Aliivibrio sifiae]|uniref:hypothetical protein n=1 Tax=Aliivibrio sifiae TaxID=566293 RepID=UPI003D14F6CF
MSSTQLSVNCYSLSELTEKEELNWSVKKIHEELNKKDIVGIANAFYRNTKIGANGIPYIRIKGLAQILRTANSGAERVLVDQGVVNVFSNSPVVSIDREEYISGPSLVGLIHTRINHSLGKTKQYLEVAYQFYISVLNSPPVRDLKERYIKDIESKRSSLKMLRIKEHNITRCEFSGVEYVSTGVVQFAHIDSVISAPHKALDIENGVIILGRIHLELTKLQIHDFDGMYDFCKERNYSLSWAK